MNGVGVSVGVDAGAARMWVRRNVAKGDRYLWGLKDASTGGNRWQQIDGDGVRFEGHSACH